MKKLAIPFALALTLGTCLYASSASAAKVGSECISAYGKNLVWDQALSSSVYGAWKGYFDQWGKKEKCERVPASSSSGPTELSEHCKEKWHKHLAQLGLMVETPFALVFDIVKAPFAILNYPNWAIMNHKYGPTFLLMNELASFIHEAADLTYEQVKETDSYKNLVNTLKPFGRDSDDDINFLVNQYFDGPIFCGNEKLAHLRPIKDVLKDMPPHVQAQPQTQEIELKDKKDIADWQ